MSSCRSLSQWLHQMVAYGILPRYTFFFKYPLAAFPRAKTVPRRSGVPFWSGMYKFDIISCALPLSDFPNLLLNLPSTPVLANAYEVTTNHLQRATVYTVLVITWKTKGLHHINIESIKHIRGLFRWKGNNAELAWNECKCSEIK